MKIAKIKARQILDSRGNPTIETDLILEDGISGRASVPSGASTGSNEALELRDKDPKNYLGKSVLEAVSNVNEKIGSILINSDIRDQNELDQKMIELDGTENKSHLGANAILSVSLAFAKACAISQRIPLYKHINNLLGIQKQMCLPYPMMNVINGGAHADFASDIQEFMIVPIGASSFAQCLKIGSEVFHTLKRILKENGYETTVGDEGGFAPKAKNGNKENLNLIAEAVTKAGYQLGEDVVFALDIAASEFWQDGNYALKAENKNLNTKEMIEYVKNLLNEYPIFSIEDPLSEDDWQGWSALTSQIGGSNNIQIVGDDLLVTNTRFLQKAIDEKACNAILVKVNQIGTLTETINAVKLAYSAGFKAIISHRSGETEDTTISHLAVGLGTGQIKTGSLSRSERIAKYNELLRIEEELGENAFMTMPFSSNSN